MPKAKLVRVPAPLVVVDTNVFIGALYGNMSAPSQLLAAEQAGKVRFVFCEETEDELYFIFSREMPGTWYPKDFGDARRRLDNIIRRSKRISVERRTMDPVPGLADNSDVIFVYAAITAEAQYLVTYDGLGQAEGLLNVRKYRGVEIITPEQFLLRTRISS